LPGSDEDVCRTDWEKNPLRVSEGKLTNSRHNEGVNESVLISSRAEGRLERKMEGLSLARYQRNLRRVESGQKKKKKKKKKKKENMQNGILNP